MANLSSCQDKTIMSSEGRILAAGPDLQIRSSYKKILSLSIEKQKMIDFYKRNPNQTISSIEAVYNRDENFDTIEPLDLIIQKEESLNNGFSIFNRGTSLR